MLSDKTPPAAIGEKSVESDNFEARNALIRAQLEKILASPGFTQSARMRRFLSFVVERSLLGETDQLKESVIGVEVFDRPPSYDPKNEPIVRTEAHRLREKIREFYERDGQNDLVIISLPKGGYVPVFEVKEVQLPQPESSTSPVAELPAAELPAAAELPKDPPAPQLTRRFLWAGVAVLAVCSAAVILSPFHRKPVPAPSLSPVTSFPGNAFRPSISPDGQRVAFVWDGGSDNFDIYVKLVNTGDPLRLTTNLDQDLDPTWSPDGRQIAFLRRSPSHQQLFVIPALGGGKRRIAEITTKQAQWSADGARYARMLGPSWSPNGEQIAITIAPSPSEPDSIYLITLETGEKRRLTRPNAADEADSEPVFSPGGDMVAFVRLRAGAGGSPDIYVQPVKGGEARRITFDHKQLAGLTWTADGRRLIFSSDRDGEYKLWQVPASGGPSVPLASAGTRAHHPSLSSDGHRLVFTEQFYSTKIWRAPLGQTGSITQTPFLSSSRKDDSPQYSPDGRRVLFISNRSGPSEIWICDADGSHPAPLGSLRGVMPGTPRWSPDGAQILFDSKYEGFGAIYAISAAGGQPQRLTPESSNSMMASWSVDGKWIYYASDRNGGWQIWKQPMAGGPPMQITKHGGREAKESPDGKTLYYTNNGPKGPGRLWHVPTGGGEEVEVPELDTVSLGRQWVLTNTGAYYISQTQPPRTFSLSFFNFETWRNTQMFPILKKPVFGTPGLAVSPDGKWILYSQVDHEGNNLMLLENFE